MAVMNLLLGLGIIGSRCADQLVAAGMPLVTWNRSLRERADLAEDLEAAAATADRVLCYLQDEVAVREVFARIGDHLRQGAAFINHATIDPETTSWLAQQCEERVLDFLDCPFTGSKDASAAGNLVYYVSGKAGVLERHREVLEVTSRLIIPVGEPPAATILKITTNLLTASTVQALSEAVALCRAYGVSAEDYRQALQGNASCSVTAEMKLAAMAQDDVTAHFSTENMLKDVNYSRALAAAKELNLPGLAATAAQLQRACEEGYAKNDFSSVARLT